MVTLLYCGKNNYQAVMLNATLTEQPANTINCGETRRNEAKRFDFECNTARYRQQNIPSNCHSQMGLIYEETMLINHCTTSRHSYVQDEHLPARRSLLRKSSAVELSPFGQAAARPHIIAFGDVESQDLLRRQPTPTFLKSPCPKEEIPRIVLDSRLCVQTL